MSAVINHIFFFMSHFFTFNYAVYVFTVWNQDLLNFRHSTEAAFDNIVQFTSLSLIALGLHFRH